MTDLEPGTIRLDSFGRREFRLMEETEFLSLREPIASVPAGDSPQIIQFPGPGRPKYTEPPAPRYASPAGLPLRPKRGLGNYMRNLSYRAYGMIKRAIGRVADYAVPRYLTAANAYGAPHVGLIDGMPLPLGGVRAEQFPGTYCVNVEPGAIPGTEENGRLGRLYRSALDFVRKKSGHFGETGRRLERFYEGIIEDLGKEPVKDVVHEYVHNLLEKLGINLKCEKNEAATTYITDRIIGRCSTMAGTTYHALKKMGKYIFEKVLGMSPERALERAEYDSSMGPRIVKAFDKHWEEAYRKAA